ncbi:TPA: glucosyltransferase domain-containing protein [Proteus mirabilis]
MNAFSQYVSKEKKAVWLCIGLSLLLVLPIILTGSIYIDDNTRTIRDFNWSGDGRFLANYFFEVLSVGNGVLDYYPWTNIFAAIITGISGVFISRSLNIMGTQNIILISTAMLSSPFMVSNLTYRFDSITMALSLILAVLPFVYYSNVKCFVLVSFASIIASSYLYQPSVSAYVGMSIIYAVYNSDSLRKLIKPLSICAVIFVISVLSFILINKLSGGVSRSEFFVSSVNPFSLLMDNLFRSVQLLLWSASGITKVLYLTALLAFCAACFKVIRSSPLLVVVYILSLLALIVVSFILNAVLLTPWFNSRTLISFPLVIVFCFALFIKHYELSYNLKNTFSLLTVTCSLLFCSVFANALSAQDSLNSVYYSKIMSKVDGDIKKVAIYGEQPRPREFVMATRVYPLIDNLVPNYMRRGNGWAQVYLHRNSSRFRMITMQEQEDIFRKSCGKGHWEKSELFDTKSLGDTLIVSFAGNFCE